jgi:hypothetical protein
MRRAREFRCTPSCRAAWVSNPRFSRTASATASVLGVEFLVGREALVQASLEDVPSLGADLHAVLGASVRVVHELEALTPALGDAQPELKLWPILVH